VQQGELALHDQLHDLLVAKAAQLPVGLQQAVGADHHPEAGRQRHLTFFDRRLLDQAKQRPGGEEVHR
jgi:hypothetical protein